MKEIDIKMKEMDAFELYDKLRKMDNNISVCFLQRALFLDTERMFYNEANCAKESSKYNKFNFKLASPSIFIK
jgi:hypothetical protein